MANIDDDIDTSTELNAGSGGSKMDESLVTRNDGTVVHRTRVVLAHADGRPASRATSGASVADDRVLEVLGRVESTLEQIHMLLLRVVSQ